MYRSQHLGFGILSALLVAAASLVACGGSGGGDPADSGTPDAGPSDDAGPGDGSDCSTEGEGTLAVEVTGLPAGVDGAVVVEGAAPRRDVTTTSSRATAAGSYTITAQDVVVADAIVRSVYRATIAGSPTCVKNGETATAKVTYALVPTSHKLWVTHSNGDSELVAFGADALRATGSPTADVASRVEIPGGLAYDKDGGLWTFASAAGERKLVHYPPATLAASGTPAADIALSSSVFTDGVPNASHLAFDASGNLWVTAPAGAKIARISKADLAASGTVTPSVILSGTVGPAAIAFDAAGNLWAAADGNRIVEYTAAKLATSSNVAPDVAITDGAGLQAPLGLAFDGSNNLWVNYNSATMVRYTPAERTGSGEIAVDAAVKVTPNDVGSLAEAIAFDESGGLWFAFATGKLARLGPDQLGATASVDPSTIVTSTSLASGSQLAFYPAPAILPLFAKR